MQKETVLVTGGCGYIGSHVVRHLSEQGYKVVVIDNLSTGRASALLHQEELIVGNIGHETLLREAFEKFRPRSVFHFAGSIVVPHSVADPLAYYENNFANSLILMKVCADAQVENFIFSSTASIYGENISGALSEATPEAPTNPYSRSKLMTERALEDLSRVESLRYVILRYFNVAGADPQSRMGQGSANVSHLIKVGCEAALGQRKGVTIYGEDYDTPDGTGIRDYIHVEDLASAHTAALRYLKSGGKSLTLNCGYGRGYSVKQVLAEMNRLAGPLHIDKGPRRPGDVASLIADNRALLSTLDWQPRYDNLSEIIRTALNWERRLLEAKAKETSPSIAA